MQAEQLERARDAYREGQWDEARAAFEAASEGEETRLSATDLEMYGTAELLSGNPDFGALERAFEAYKAADEVHDAARVAIDVSSAWAMRGNYSLANGWFRHAERVVEGRDEGPGHGMVTCDRAFLAVVSGRVQEALKLLDEAHAIARRHDDSDTQALILNRRARVHMRLGHVEQAQADLDEAMLLVHRGVVRPFPAAMIYCNTIDVCRDMSDYERALEWTEAASSWIGQRRVWCFPGVCRVHRAELLRIQGEHGRAQQEVKEALGMFERLNVKFCIGEALCELARQQLEAGDLDGAEESFARAREVGLEGLPGPAILRMRRGDHAGARAMLSSALEERAENPLGRSALLPAFVEASIELGELDEARQAVEELEATAGHIGTAGLRASAATAAARLHLASGDGHRALRSAKAATKAWNLVGARVELVRARELLTAAYTAVGDSVRAKLEAETIHAERNSLRSSAAPPEAGAADTQPIAAESGQPHSPGAFIREGVTIDDKIEVREVLGVGGMGIVYAGHHRITGRDVALKVLKQRVCGDERECQRFLAEAMACGRIHHPNVVDIYDAGQRGDEPYIVMEKLVGRALDEELAEADTGLPIDRVLTIAEQVARGLAAAHAVGVVHRDLKPANVFLVARTDQPELVKVLDFGLSKVPDAGHTRPGELLGTPYYMAPEQIAAPDQVGVRTDIHALGAVMFEMLAGRPPFVADSIPALLFAITHGPRPNLSEHREGLPKTVLELVERALARDPEDRFESAEAFAAAIADARGG